MQHNASVVKLGWLQILNHQTSVYLIVLSWSQGKRPPSVTVQRDPARTLSKLPEVSIR